MIKLNNKNITYVALADSNNSIKAPKEVWYADSSNSVKLVYRRKDALIEGEDYEKYHWLEGRNGAYIDTRYVPIPSEDSFKFKINNNGFWKNPNNDDPHVFGVYSPRIRFGTFASAENRYFFQYSNVVEGAAPHFTSSDYIQEVTLLNDGTKTKCIANGIESDYGTTITEQFNDSIWLYAINNAPSKYFHGDIAYFRITDHTFTTDKLHFIPCKLLKPVPKWLDANGIRRQVGECGMIDLVSGKFYGNVNNVGTFTVENYYERKEWLQGRNGAYINTNHKLVTIEDRFECSIKYDGNSVNPDNREQWIFGVWNNNDVIGNYIARADNKLGVLYKVDNQLWCRCTENYIHKFETFVNGSSFYCIDNGLQFSDSTNGLTEKTINSPCYLYACNGLDATQYFHGDIAYFKITDASSNTKMNLIPCTLTMDLPASMDANNIARTKGTSGMWDLVSDRFYGNVASSGTFKAVNLAEGVDYEVHQWLNFVNNGNNSTTFMSLPVNSDTFSFERQIVQYANSAILVTGSNSYSYGNSSSGQLLRIWDYTEGTSVYNMNVSTETPTREFKSTSNSLLVNEVEIPKYGFPINSVVWRCNSGYSCKNSSITIDGIVHYIPVKLLKSIPSKYDANGIARQAGECGMYDTVNDKFYGNVASSGSFTVSDD